MIYQTSSQLKFFSDQLDKDSAQRIGLRLGKESTHTSRTIMIEELSTLFTVVAGSGTREEYSTAIIEENCLAKVTMSSRRLTRQRLSELYGLDPAILLFRVLRRLWESDLSGRALLALLTALARDPLLLATAPSVVLLKTDEEFQRGTMRDALHHVAGQRLNDASLDKVVRNAASSWTQSGHLKGRTFKVRQPVHPTPHVIAFALFIGHAAGFRGEELLNSGWTTVLDAHPYICRALALDAKRLGLLDIKASGNIFEVNFERLDPFGGRNINGKS